jgi:hypothetical protein
MYKIQKTANVISIAAVSISTAAFLGAYLQLLLGSSVTTSALWKTHRAALGNLVHQRLWQFAVKRVKVTYPEISFKFEDLIAAAGHSDRTKYSGSGHKVRTIRCFHGISLESTPVWYGGIVYGRSSPVIGFNYYTTTNCVVSRHTGASRR